MNDLGVISALDRIDAALARAEEAARDMMREPRASVPGDGEFAALRARHNALKQAVATGLRQIDDMLSVMPR